MALVQALIAMILRSLGRILNTAFGWATMMLFGKVPSNRQLLLSLSSLASIVWIAAVIGIASPAFATILFTFAKLPKSVDPTWVRLAMAGVAALVPIGVGVTSIFMLEPADRPKGAKQKMLAIARGYPHTLGLALTLILMIAFAPILKLREAAVRGSATHVPIMIEPGDYEHVLREVEDALRAGGIETERRRASFLLRFPTKVLALFAGGSISRLVTEELTRLDSEHVEVMLHPCDLIVVGRAPHSARARAILAERLASTKAYLTWTKEANELEDRLRRARLDAGARDTREAMRGLSAIEGELRKLEVEYEEWEVLFRETLQVERCVLLGGARLISAGDPCERKDEARERGEEERRRAA